MSRQARFRRPRPAFSRLFPLFPTFFPPHTQFSFFVRDYNRANDSDNLVKINLRLLIASYVQHF
jgi:hypothetical protein